MFQNMKLSVLVKKCREQTRLYLKKKKHIMEYCLEIFRRAFKLQCDESLKSIYNTYRPLVSWWVKSHPYTGMLDLPYDNVVLDIISQFVISLRRKTEFYMNSMAEIMSYWKKCAHSVIMKEVRKKQRLEVCIDDINIEGNENPMDERLFSEQLWDHIKKLLDNEDDLLLLRLLYVQNLKPRQIVKHYKDKWSDTNEIRVQQQKIKRHLKKSAVLKQMLENS